MSIALDFVCRSGRWVSFDYLLDCNGAHGATVYADSACQVPFAPPDAAPPDAAPPDATPPDAAPPATCVQGGACSREGGVCATAESYCVQCSAMRWIYGPRNFTCSGGHWNEIQVDCNPWAPGGYVDPACTVPASSGVDDGGVVDAGVADGG